MPKGIRVSQLAKELNVESKMILGKLRDEGLGDQAPSHTSMLSLGLAESVREWFSSVHGAGTAVELAPPVEVVAKKTSTRTRRKKATVDKTPTATDTIETEPEITESPDEPMDAPVATITEEAPPDQASVVPVEVPASPPDEPVQPVQTETPASPTEPPVAPAVVASSSESPVLEEPVVETPVESPKPAPVTPPPGSRPAVTLANKGKTSSRKPVRPAPRMVAPTPAVMQGPKIVREEQPEHVPAPRRRPSGPNASGPTFVQARPVGGRGVRVADDDESDESKRKAGKSKTLSSRRRTLDGRRGEADEKLREFSDADLRGLEERLAAASQSRAAFDSHLKKSEARGTHAQARTAVQRGGSIEVEEPITIRTLSAAMGAKSSELISKLMRQGTFATINQSLDRELAESLAMDFGVELKIKRQKSQEELLADEFDARKASSSTENLKSRPTVVTILGHVDHGKTSLLDKIRNANVAAGEAGGITQHTAAWIAEVGDGENKKRVTFIDTPGHQAFTSMRARGANMTDVVVLVVSAAEGVQPQTVESINHARAAGVPLIVALNKIDRPDANADMVMGQLAKENLNPVEWGGDTELIRTSAVTGQGIQELIEMLDYQAQLLELKSDPTAPARGTVIESRMDEGLGPVATVLVQDGTLHVGDVLLCGNGFGRIRSLLNDRSQMVQDATASTPVIISGLSEVPNAGDKFYVVGDLDRARAIAEERQMLSRQAQLSTQGRVSLDNLLETMKANDTKTINLIVKGDVQGSVETLAKTVTEQNTEEVRVRVIHSAVGPITESDVELADASQAVIIGFHVAPDEPARAMAEQRRVEIRTYRVIYEIFDDLKKALSGLLEPEIREKYHGRAEIRRVYKISKLGTIAGCMVVDGHIQRGSKIRLIRDGHVITEDLSIETLRRVKDDVREVKQGLECGIKLAGYDDIKEGDVLEGYIRETIARTL